MIELKKENVAAAYNKADAITKEVIALLVGKENIPSAKSGSIFDRVKTFEDACAELGTASENVLPFLQPSTPREHAINDYTRLDVIAEALQEGEKCDWTDSDQRKWRPWFEHNTTGFGFSYSGYVDSYTGTTVGSRLCFLSEKKSDYFGKKFIEIHNRLLTNKY